MKEKDVEATPKKSYISARLVISSSISSLSFEDETHG